MKCEVVRSCLAAQSKCFDVVELQHSLGTATPPVSTAVGALHAIAPEDLPPDMGRNMAAVAVSIIPNRRFLGSFGLGKPCFHFMLDE